MLGDKSAFPEALSLGVVSINHEIIAVIRTPLCSRFVAAR